jgi:hypothetical protein
VGADPDAVADGASAVEAPLQIRLGADDHAVAQLEGLEVLEADSTANVQRTSHAARQGTEEHPAHHGVEIAITMGEA